MNKPAAAREFDLFLRDGQKRFFWKLANHGIAVWGDGLSWEYDGETRRKKFSEISAVHLSSGNVAREGVFYACQITFDDGTSLVVQSTTDMGLPDDEKAAIYGDFVRTLHSQLEKSGAKDISYRAGMSEGKHAFAVGTLVVAGLLFVALPVGLFIFLEASWHVLGIIAAGVGLVWPVWKQIETNAPHEYTADNLPAELVP